MTGGYTAQPFSLALSALLPPKRSTTETKDAFPLRKRRTSEVHRCQHRGRMGGNRPAEEGSQEERDGSGPLSKGNDGE